MKIKYLRIFCILVVQLFSANVFAEGVQLPSELQEYSQTSNLNPNYSPIFLKTLELRFESLVIENSVYVWELIDYKDRIPHYCKDECACIAKTYLEFLSHFRSLKGKYKSVLVRAKKVSLLGVEVFLDEQHTRIANYSYHVAIIVEDANGIPGVIDPVVFKTLTPVSLSDWLARFVGDLESYSFSVTNPKAK